MAKKGHPFFGGEAGWFKKGGHPGKEFKKGQIPWNKGKKGTFKHTEEHKKKMSKRMKGKNSPSWKGGISKTREYQNFHSKLAKRKRRKVIGSHTFIEWELLKKQYGYRCPCCGRCEPKIQLTEDHIIPIIKGGSNYIENIQPLCMKCNNKKQTKIIKYENFLNS